jgi:hypothetical protein
VVGHLRPKLQTEHGLGKSAGSRCSGVILAKRRTNSYRQINLSRPTVVAICRLKLLPKAGPTLRKLELECNFK